MFSSDLVTYQHNTPSRCHNYEIIKNNKQLIITRITYNKTLTWGTIKTTH